MKSSTHEWNMSVYLAARQTDGNRSHIDFGRLQALGKDLKAGEKWSFLQVLQPNVLLDHCSVIFSGWEFLNTNFLRIFDWYLNSKSSTFVSKIQLFSFDFSILQRWLVSKRTSSPDSFSSDCQRQLFPVALRSSNFAFFGAKTQSSSRSSWRHTTNTGRSTELQHWPPTRSWMLPLRSGRITCCPLTGCSTVRAATARTSSPCWDRLVSVSQVWTALAWGITARSDSVLLGHPMDVCLHFLCPGTGKEAVESWYSEIKDYNWSSPGFSGNTGK